MAYSNAATTTSSTICCRPISASRTPSSGEPLRGAPAASSRARPTRSRATSRQLYDNAFIETCEPWVVPYIGDLVGTTPLFDESRVRDGDTAARAVPATWRARACEPPIALRSRADVAKTIYYRRRKGTLPMLEELARDVTGWAAHAVEFFELLGWTQWLRNHLRLHALRTPDIRSVERMDRLDARLRRDRPHRRRAPDRAARGLAQHPQYRLLPLAARRLSASRRSQARRLGGAGDFRYHFSPLGNPAPLFSRRRPRGRRGRPRDRAARAAADPAGALLRGPARASRPADAAARLHASSTGCSTRFRRLQRSRRRPSFMRRSSTACRCPPSACAAAISRTWSQPPTDLVGDRRRARPAGARPDAGACGDDVEVYYHYGFPADLGGGPYRPARLADATLALADAGARRRRQRRAGHVPPRSTPRSAQWAADGGRNAIIRIRDNRTYAEALAIDVGRRTGASSRSRRPTASARICGSTGRWP